MDVGANYRLNENITGFINYNQAFQSPDIDRFFNWGGTFNGFIEPAKAKTINLGFNQLSSNNRLKMTIFHATIDKEIYFDPLTGINTNFDRSHKYGLEIQDFYNLTKQLSTSLLYNYTRAIIDIQNNASNSFNGKELPGVPRHTITGNLNYKFFDHATFNLNHTWRSSAYAYDDFTNSATQKQQHYESTNLGLSYQYKNLQFFSSISNLFGFKNAIQVSNDAVYPVDFMRIVRIGMKSDF